MNRKQRRGADKRFQDEAESAKLSLESFVRKYAASRGEPDEALWHLSNTMLLWLAGGTLDHQIEAHGKTPGAASVAAVDGLVNAVMESMATIMAARHPDVFVGFGGDDDIDNFGDDDDDDEEDETA